MKFKINRETLLPTLQIVCGVVERRQTLPILSNILLTIENNFLSLMSTDMEVELMVRLAETFDVSGEITLPARKLLDICRTLPESAELDFEINNDKTRIRSERSRFTLATLPATEFPSIDITETNLCFTISQERFRTLLENTQFAMAQQDVRYYLNGLLLELENNRLRAVATDGHRLALDETDIIVDIEEPLQIIVPRKGISELMRLLKDSEDEAQVQISTNHIRIIVGNLQFTSKLIDGRFPDYQRVIPQEPGSFAIVNRERLKQSLTRASILSNEKYRGIRVILQKTSLRALAHNQEQEEAEEEIEVEYSGDELEIGFNVAYLLDTLGIIKTEKVRIGVSDSNSSCLILPEIETESKYVVMPMRL
jgi:DNA polymerase-3 subunit beta